MGRASVYPAMIGATSSGSTRAAEGTGTMAPDSGACGNSARHPSAQAISLVADALVWLDIGHNRDVFLHEAGAGDRRDSDNGRRQPLSPIPLLSRDELQHSLGLQEGATTNSHRDPAVLEQLMASVQSRRTNAAPGAPDERAAGTALHAEGPAARTVRKQPKQSKQ